MTNLPTYEQIKINQVWRNKRSSYQLLISGKKGGKWLAKVLTDKPGVYNGSHKMSSYTLWHKFDLVP